MTNAERWIVLPDLQVPYHDTVTLKAVEAYMADHRWDGYINLGDFLDFNALSRYVKDSPGAVLPTDDVAATFAEGKKILTRHAKILRAKNPRARMVLLEGNHDYRAVSYAEAHPGMKDQLNVPEHLDLKGLRVEWVPSWSKGKLFKLGKAFFTHGLITTKYHAAVMAQRYGVPIYYGHTHDVQEFPIVLHGEDKTVVGKSLGCLCRYDQSYLKGAPTNWQQAFAVFHVMKDGFYTEYTTRIFKHRFVSPEGKIYDGRNL